MRPPPGICLSCAACDPRNHRLPHMFVSACNARPRGFTGAHEPESCGFDCVTASAVLRSNPSNHFLQYGIVQKWWEIHRILPL